MYTSHFGLDQEPFSIAPDPRFLFLSEAHNEALAHLMYGFSHGGFVLITGEVGTGKTTLLRNLLDRTPPELDVAFVLNPRLTVRELLETLCDELGVAYNSGDVQSVKQYIDVLNRHLLKTHQAGRSTVVIIDEAQNLSPAVLEQIRLLTNLETNERKLLRIILLGQPELADLLARNELRQLAQRITARYHLEPLRRSDIRAYVDHRLRKAGGQPYIFDDSAIRALYSVSKGTPRLINIIADRALLGAYVEGVSQVNGKLIRRAAREVLDQGAHRGRFSEWAKIAGVVGIVLLCLGTYMWLTEGGTSSQDSGTEPTAPSIEQPADNQPSSDQARPEGTNTVSNTNGALPSDSIETSTTSAPSTDNRTQSASPQSNLTEPAPVAVRRPVAPNQRTQRQAYQAVFAKWGSQYPLDAADIPCNFAPQAGLQCLGRRGGWSEVNQLNTPVVLELWDDSAQPFHAALLSKQGNQYEIQLGNETLYVTPRDLRDTWFGAYVILWQTPPNYLGSLRLGDEHSTVAWLHQRLLDIMPQYAGTTPDNRFDQELHDLVLEFQRSEGLLADGIVGPLTWIRLSDRLNLPAPKLTNSGA